MSIQKTSRKELIRFLIAGFSAVFTDMGTYYLILSVLPPSAAKVISFICGTVVAYLLNKFWTFEKKKFCHKEMIRFALLYCTTLGVNVLVNKVALEITDSNYLFSFLAATGTSTVLNFIGQKWWVFR